MFDHYMSHQFADPRRRSRLLLASVAAALGCTLSVGMMWTSHQLSLGRVDAPSLGNFEFTAINLLETPDLTKPPPTPPPEEPARAVIPEDELFERIEKADTPRDSSPHRDDPSKPSKEKPTLFESIGSQGCPVGAVCHGTDTGKRAFGPGGGGSGDGDGDGDGDCKGAHCEGEAAGPVKFERLRCRACADPAVDTLRKTPAAAMHRSGVNETRFCVDEDGRTYDVATKRSLGDAAVDRICRDTVRKWRFAPMQIAGKARRACSSVRFDIRFDR
jgi:TonB family protein